MHRGRDPRSHEGKSIIRTGERRSFETMRGESSPMRRHLVGHRGRGDSASVGWEGGG